MAPLRFHDAAGPKAPQFGPRSGAGLRNPGKGLETPPMSRLFRSGLAAVLGALLSAAAAPPLAAAPRHAARPAEVAAVRPWSRPATAGASGVGYMTLVNRGPSPAVLVKVESPLARRVEMHRSSLKGAVMSMAPEPRIEAPAHGEVTFGPGGYHLMFVDLARPLKPGDRLPATLVFADGRRLTVDFAVGTGAGPPNGRN